MRAWNVAWLLVLVTLVASGPSHGLVQGDLTLSGPVAGGSLAARSLPFPGLTRGFPGGVVEWYYNAEGAPPALEAQAEAIIQAAAMSWSSACAVRFVYRGRTTRRAMLWDGQNVVGWSRQVAAGSAETAAYYGASGVLEDADVALNPSLDAASLYTLMAHEWGHALGLTHSDVAGALMSGPPLTSYTGLSAPVDDDVQQCHALYDQWACPRPVPAPVVHAIACAPPAVGTRTVRESYACASNGTWTPVPPVEIANACSVPGVAAPPPTLVTPSPAAPPVIASPVVTPPPAAPVSPPPAVPPGAPVATPAPLSPVARGATPATHALREYYHAALDDYFVTADPAEQAALEATGSPWRATGASFGVWLWPTAGAAAVCRFYGDWRLDPATGRRRGPDTHFHSASAEECDEVARRFPVWVLESAAAFHAELPVAGRCAAGRVAVVRWFRPWGAPVHRFTVESEGVALVMRNVGWVLEGGVFCAPPAP